MCSGPKCSGEGAESSMALPENFDKNHNNNIKLVHTVVCCTFLATLTVSITPITVFAFFAGRFKTALGSYVSGVFAVFVGVLHWRAWVSVLSLLLAILARARKCRFGMVRNLSIFS